MQEKKLRIKTRSKDVDKVKRLYHKIALDFGLSDDVVRSIIESPYDFTHKTIVSIPLKELESQEEFNELKTNFMYKYLGKLVTDYNLVKKIRKNITNKIKSKDGENN